MARVPITLPDRIAGDSRFDDFTVEAWYDDASPNLVFAKAKHKVTGSGWQSAGCNLDDNGDFSSSRGLREAIAKLFMMVFKDAVLSVDTYQLKPGYRNRGITLSNAEPFHYMVT